MQSPGFIDMQQLARELLAVMADRDDLLKRVYALEKAYSRLAAEVYHREARKSTPLDR